MKFLKITSALLAALFLFSACSQPEQGDDTDRTVSMEDNANPTDEEQDVTDDGNDDTEHQTGLIKTVDPEEATDFLILENGNVLLLRQTPSQISDSEREILEALGALGESLYEEGGVIIYDSVMEEKIAEIPIESDSNSKSVRVQIVEDGFAVIASHGEYIKLYDNYGNETKTINLPYYDTVYYAVSYDKTRIVYFYNDMETTESHLMTDSVDLDDEKEILTIDASDETRTLLNIDKLFSYKNGIIAFSGRINERYSSGNHMSICGSCNYDGEEIVYNKLGDLEILNTNAVFQENYFVIIEDSDEYGNPTSGIVKYQKYEEDEIGELTCEELDENRFAVISGNGKYIATAIGSVAHSSDTERIVKIYDTSNGELLYTYTLNSEENGTTLIFSIRINEQKREAYILTDVITVIGF